MVDEGLPQRVQDVFYSQSFEHGDIGPILHDSEREAGVNGPAIHRRRAGAALTIVTTLFRTREVEMIEKRIELGRSTAPALVTLCCPLTLSATEHQSSAPVSLCPPPWLLASCRNPSQ